MYVLGIVGSVTSSDVVPAVVCEVLKPVMVVPLRLHKVELYGPCALIKTTVKGQFVLEKPQSKLKDSVPNPELDRAVAV